MNERFGAAVAGSLSPDDSAARDRRQAAAEAAVEAGWPSTETEEWRYSPIGALPFDGLEPSLGPPSAAPPGSGLIGSERAATVTIVDGWLASLEVEPGWAAKGLAITTGPVAMAPDGVGSGAPQPAASNSAFDLLHQAFCPAPVRIEVPAGLSVVEPIVVEQLHQGTGVDGTGGIASFPHLQVSCGDDAEVTVIEIQRSGDEVGLSVPLVELSAGPAARLRYQVIQELGAAHWQIGRQVPTAASQATLSLAQAAFGGHYARVRTDGHLTGRGASAEMATAYYGDGDQIHDFRVFQHHLAPNTRSDLLFKGAQDDASGSIYTGMIHIHPDGAGSNAFQTNRNVKLSPDAWAWSVPNLEIENNEVHCSHASTVSPVDVDQQFYLASRGVPPVAADRLIVAGFFDEVVGRMVPAVGDEARARIAAKLDRRTR